MERVNFCEQWGSNVAAHHLGMSEDAFLAAVADGKLPKPVVSGEHPRWDSAALWSTRPKITLVADELPYIRAVL